MCPAPGRREPQEAQLILISKLEALHIAKTFLVASSLPHVRIALVFTKN
jgi:hypothetical protein